MYGASLAETTFRRRRKNCCNRRTHILKASSGFDLLSIQRLPKPLEIGSKGCIDPLTLGALRVQPSPCFIAVDRSSEQKCIARLTVFHKRFECPRAQFFWPSLIQNPQALVRFLRLVEKLAGLRGIFCEQDGLKKLSQKIIQRVWLARHAIQPGTRRKLRGSRRLKSFGAHVVIKGMKPFVSQTAGAGVLGQGQLPGGWKVMSCHAGPSTNAILEAQRIASRTRISTE